jgi:arylsulfatase A-like enzyme
LSFKEGQLAIRQGYWVLIPSQGSDGTTLKGEHHMMSYAELKCVNSDYTPDGKLKPDSPPGQLYNLRDDLSQQHNLYEKYPERVAQMKARLEEIKDRQTNGEKETKE